MSVRGSDDAALADAIGRAISEAMGEMSQADLATLAGLDQPTVSKLVNGRRLTPLTVWELVAIERATGRESGWILRRAGLLPALTAAESDHVNRAARKLVRDFVESTKS